MIELSAIFLASLLGSWHCAAMCGGFSFILNKSRHPKWAASLYHLGRLASYLILTSAAYLIGAPLKDGPWTAVILMLLGLWFLALVFDWNILRLPMPSFVTATIKKFISTQSPWTGLVLGLATTFLPCVWLYGFVILSTQAAHLSLALATISVFWLGTVPALLLAHWAFFKTNRVMGSYSQKAAALLMLIVSVLTLTLHSPLHHLLMPGHHTHGNMSQPHDNTNENSDNEDCEEHLHTGHTN